MNRYIGTEIVSGYNSATTTLTGQRVVAIGADGVIAAPAACALNVGILLDDCVASGQQQVITKGQAYVYNSASVTKGDKLMTSASGTVLTATGTDTFFAIALETAGTVGSLVYVSL